MEASLIWSLSLSEAFLAFHKGSKPRRSGTFLSLSTRGDDGLDIFSMSDQKVVALEISITNFPSDVAEPQRDGEDAYEAMLFVLLPPTLPYSASRPYNATVRLGNPCEVSLLGGGGGI